MFQRFHRVRNARSRTHEGSGIGLALVRELVKLHGGDIGLESREGVGTTFTVRLPKGKQHLPAERIGAARAACVDADRRASRSSRKRCAGCRTRSADSASRSLASRRQAAAARARSPARRRQRGHARLRSALARAPLRRRRRRRRAAGARRRSASELPDLVLTDVMMPRLDGFGLLAAIRADARTRSLPVIMLSARAGEEARIEGLGAGADDYLVKPFSARELLARVGSHLALAGTAQRARACVALPQRAARDSDRERADRHLPRRRRFPHPRRSTRSRGRCSATFPAASRAATSTK